MVNMQAAVTPIAPAKAMINAPAMISLFLTIGMRNSSCTSPYLAPFTAARARYSSIFTASASLYS